jgi:hypothetical protein
MLHPTIPDGAIVREIGNFHGVQQTNNKLANSGRFTS